MNNEGKHSTRVAVISGIVSLTMSIVFSAYVIGQRTGKVLQLEAWQKETAPRVERMDLEGSVATKNFILNYEKEQAKQYERLKHLEDQVGHLETMEFRINRLERNHSQKPE